MLIFFFNEINCGHRVGNELEECVMVVRNQSGSHCGKRGWCLGKYKKEGKNREGERNVLEDTVVAWIMAL